MLNATRLFCAIALPLLMSGCQSISTPPIQPVATPGAVGVVHGAARAQLDPAHAQRILAITGDGDQGLIALRACQKYARIVAR
jgi:hypothetical protein